MEEVAKMLLGMGLGGILVLALLYLCREVFLKQLPAWRSEHNADLRRAHETCETKLTEMTAEFHAFLRQERTDSLAMQGRMIDRLESLETTMVAFLKENMP